MLYYQWVMKMPAKKFARIAPFARRNSKNRPQNGKFAVRRSHLAVKQATAGEIKNL